MIHDIIPIFFCIGIVVFLWWKICHILVGKDVLGLLIVKAIIIYNRRPQRRLGIIFTFNKILYRGFIYIFLFVIFFSNVGLLNLLQNQILFLESRRAEDEDVRKSWPKNKYKDSSILLTFVWLPFFERTNSQARAPEE